MPANHSKDAEMTGWLYKWTNYLKGYQKRWFVVNNGLLSYYRKDRNKEGGGLAFLIKNLYYEDIAINIPNTSDLEAQEISTKTKTSSIKEKVWNFKKANWNLYQQNTNEDFRKAPTRIKDLEQNWISFKNTIIKAAKVSIPRGNSYQISSKIKFEIKDKKVEKKARKIIHDCKNVTSTHNIFHEKINMKELDYALENTELNKTPGPDGIHGQMISNLGKNGKEKLLDIFNNSWKTGKLPQDWKTATIIPIKKLDKSADDPKNYRPISLTSICCKLMEKIILRRLTYHLDTRNLLPKEQYGFRKGHGTIDQLLFFTQKVKDAQNRKPTSHTIAAFLDLTQAFDKEIWYLQLQNTFWLALDALNRTFGERPLLIIKQLEEHELMEFVNQEEMSHTCRGSIRLDNAVVHTEDSVNFVVSNSATQTFHLKASTEVEKQSWITAIEISKSRAIRQLESGKCFLKLCIPSTRGTGHDNHHGG
ncbi:hypothetical protein LAZ67_15001813 [Cordylochernes scorpioides]|uniref:PH domain-containing protein n=1 Tax=Cordylochernes scorpioides TaxID=51811 RepID=A0ABY6LB34_9ARAC|nr:hypothetical protein LAZ67_15001813 [Cordylochernes scorpioides]